MSATLQVYLLRHGETVCPSSFYGHLDVELSERGRAQAEAQARWLERVQLSAIYCSDLQRARHGALAVSTRQTEAHGSAPPLESLAALREMHLGVFEGLEFAKARARFPELAGLRYQDLLETRIPGGETVRDVNARVLPCAQELTERHLRADKGAGTAIAIVAHNTVLRLTLAHYAGLGPAGYVRFKQSCGAISRVDLATASGPDAIAEATIMFSNMLPT